LAPVTAVSHVIVTDPNVVATGGFSQTVAEGSAAVTDMTVATFTDAGGLEEGGDYTATIDWGDSTTSAGTIVVDGDGNATGVVTGSHTYSGDSIGGQSEGTAVVMLTALQICLAPVTAVSHV